MKVNYKKHPKDMTDEELRGFHNWLLEVSEYWDNTPNPLPSEIRDAQAFEDVLNEMKERSKE